MLRRRFIAATAALPFMPGLAGAQTATLCSENGAPGAVFGALDGEISTCGVATPGGREVVAADAFHIGSLTKSMTATLVARLVEGGVIGWNDTVAQHLGGQIPDISPAFADVTFVDLLQHRSGLPANLGLITTLALSGANRDVLADRRAAAVALLTGNPAGPRGTLLYANAGYIVAGAMLEAVTGTAWEELIFTHVFAPLGMEGVGFGAPSGPDPVLGHKPGLFGGLNAMPPGPEADNIVALGPAGTVHLPIAALLRFLEVHATRTDFLLPESWDRLHIPPPDNDGYAMGWRLQEDGTLRHNGSNTFWYGGMAIDPVRGHAAAVLTNSGDIDRMRPLVAAQLDQLIR
jgi:D-alanyl-D-alanine carboxypeptidase